MDVTLLGPQRRASAARAAVRELMPDGPIATVNAGWQERETQSAELDDVLGGRMVNLELHRRWDEVTSEDPGYAAAERRLTLVLAEMRVLYGVRLDHQLAALAELSRRGEVPAVQEAAMAEALEAVQVLDARHLAAVTAARAEFAAAVGLDERESVRRHRQEVAGLVRECTGTVVAGGHVGVLLDLLRLFALAPLLRPPVVAWSAGAMALAERVVLFHDRSARGARPAEVYAEGLGTYRGVLAFPHARRRLRLDDPGHLGRMARRFAPARCLLLADGERVDLRADGAPPAGARWLDPAVGLVPEEAA